MSTQISLTELYDLLSIKLGREEARNLTNYIDTKIDKTIEDQTKVLATKEDMNALRKDMNALQLSIKDDSIVLLKWMISIFITIVIMILGLYATILLK